MSSTQELGLALILIALVIPVMAGLLYLHVWYSRRAQRSLDAYDRAAEYQTRKRTLKVLKGGKSEPGKRNRKDN